MAGIIDELSVRSVGDFHLAQPVRTQSNSMRWPLDTELWMPHRELTAWDVNERKPILRIQHGTGFVSLVVHLLVVSQTYRMALISRPRQIGNGRTWKGCMYSVPGSIPVQCKTVPITSQGPTGSVAG